MNISISQAQGNVPITIIKLDGRLDGQNYQELITKAQELYSQGTCDFLLDLSDLTYLSSAGLVALHSIALLARGERLPNLEGGWQAYRSLGRASEVGLQKHVKLFNPRPEVINILDVVGFGNVFEIFTNLDKAINSFS